MRITTRNPFGKVKNHKYYTDEEIEALVKRGEKEKLYCYDFLIDKLYLLPDDNKRNTKKSYEYSYLSARVLKEREIKEISIDKFYDV